MCWTQSSMNTDSEGRAVDLSNKVLTVFQRFDSNGDGSIDRSELKQVMQTLNPTLWTDRRISRLLAALDRNRDGRLQYPEFVHWACSEDTNKDLKAFREALDLSQEEAKAAPRSLPSIARRPARSNSRPRSKPSSARAAVPRASSASKPLVRRRTSGDIVGNTSLPRLDAGEATSTSKPLVRRRTSGDLTCNVSLPSLELDVVTPVRLDATCPLPQVLPATEASAEAREELSAERLIIFDFDGTITVDKDEKFKGLTGHRLSRLKDMMARIRASSARCILVTAQFPHATQEITIPSLRRTGLSGFFENELLDSRLQLYWDDAAHGTIYNGAKVMMGKIDLIKKIINGENCWRTSFAPSNVLFIDDDSRNFKGYEQAGIQIRLVGQDGMVDEDMEVVEAFAQE